MTIIPILSAAVIAFAFGMWAQWFLLIKRPFQLHIRFPQGQVLVLGIPAEFWRYTNGNEPLRLQISDDGKPQPIPVTQMPQNGPIPQPVNMPVNAMNR